MILLAPFLETLDNIVRVLAVIQAQNDQSQIVRYWMQFASVVNEWLLYGYSFFMRIYPWGWLYLLLGLWMSFMLYWAKEFPKFIRVFYYMGFLGYLVALPFVMKYLA
ncbi:MAG: hypothetical protein ABEK50_12355 [bacterium]